MSSFTIFLVMDGISYSGGIFFQTFKEYFNASKTQTSWIGSVLTGTYLSVGPVAGALANRFGCRTVATAGSLIAGVSFFVSTFSTSMPILILTYGLFAGFFVPFIYLPTVAQDLGIDAVNASFLISMIGIANTVGRVVVGYVSDQPWADCLWINNIALVVSGVSTGLIPFLETLFLLRIYSFVFGTSVAVIVSLQSIIMVELMGLEKLTNAFGLVIMCQGISSFIGAPIAGFLSDLTGDYNISFYVAGFTLTLSGLICFPLRCVARWELAQYPRKFAPEST